MTVSSASKCGSESWVVLPVQFPLLRGRRIPCTVLSRKQKGFISYYGRTSLRNIHFQREVQNAATKTQLLQDTQALIAMGITLCRLFSVQMDTKEVEKSLFVCFFPQHHLLMVFELPKCVRKLNSPPCNLILHLEIQSHHFVCTSNTHAGFIDFNIL